MSFSYNLTQTAEYESDEISQVLVSIDDLLYGQADHDFVDQVVGNGNGGVIETTGWKNCRLHLGTLYPGRHTIIIGGYNNRKNSSRESTEILIDDVLVKYEDNSPPVSQNQTVNATENTAVHINLRAQDDDGDPLTYSIVTDPGHGTLSGQGPDVTYTPDTGYTGMDSFYFKVNDGMVDSNVASVTIAVNPTANQESAERSWWSWWRSGSRRSRGR